MRSRGQQRESSTRRAGSAPVADPAGVSGLRILAPVALTIIVIDQLTKWWAVSELDGGRKIDLIWTARFNLARNSGTAFSLGTSLTPIISVIAIAVSVAIVIYARRIGSGAAAATLGLVLGGALGNVVDRIFREGNGFLGGAVIDFVDLQWWPIFNVADMAIVVGGILLAWYITEDAERAKLMFESDEHGLDSELDG